MPRHTEQLRHQPLWRRGVAAAAFAALGFAAVATAAAGDAEAPLQALPYTPSLDVSAMDRSANPCEDFYQFSCGGWSKANPIPPDESRWSVYAKMADENQRYLWGVLQSLADKKDAAGTQKQLGDYFAACMDTQAVEAAGSKPLQQALEPLQQLRSKADLAPVLATLHRHGLDGYPFRYGSGQDLDAPEQVIAFIGSAGQGRPDGLGLPDRDAYFRTDAKSREVLAKYRRHVLKTFELMGQSTAAAARSAGIVLAVETRLAKAQLTRVQLRDPYAIKHTMALAQLQKLTPGFDWSAYRKTLGAPDEGLVNVEQPRYVSELWRWMRAARLSDIDTYLRWHIARASSEFLSQSWRAADFAFYEQALRGTPQERPRWKQCVGWADEQLGEALGKEFVERNFSAETKAGTLRMTLQIEDAMVRRIDALDWMSAATKKEAKDKLRSIVNKIGYPERWIDYSGYRVERGDLFGNVVRGREFLMQRELAKIGKPVDRGEWGMTPQTVNAYYSPQTNDINFPAAVLLPPLYDPKLDDAPNYGNTGGTIGHELTHAFDDEGRQFDGSGRLRNWWTKDDAKAFEARTSCLKKQYATYPVVDDIHINSDLTLGEDLADLGGLILGWAAWQEQTKNQKLTVVDGLTPEQRFFVGYAQWTCGQVRPEAARLRARTDPHSPGPYRVNGVVVNMPQFEQAFSCKAGQAMVKPDGKRCHVW